jgi:hypothetical protein
MELRTAGEGGGGGGGGDTAGERRVRGGEGVKMRDRRASGVVRRERPSGNGLGVGDSAMNGSCEAMKTRPPSHGVVVRVELSSPGADDSTLAQAKANHCRILIPCRGQLDNHRRRARPVSRFHHNRRGRKPDGRNPDGGVRSFDSRESGAARAGAAHQWPRNGDTPPENTVDRPPRGGVTFQRSSPPA